MHREYPLHDFLIVKNKSVLNIFDSIKVLLVKSLIIITTSTRFFDLHCLLLSKEVYSFS